GGLDPYTPNASTMIYHKLRTMGVPAELHLFPNKPHGAFGFERTVEFMRQLGYLGELEPEVEIMTRYPDDNARAEYIKEEIWPEGRMPDFRENQCHPYLEWHIPANRTTDAIQIIYSGGSYMGNGTEGFEVAPARRFLNEKGVTVVTVQYRTPRPEGLAKHTTAWQDLQRAIRVVRSEAASRGLNPDKIGIMGSSAGGHLTVMGVTSSLHKSYWPIDDIDKLSCSVQWGIGIYPAYILTDGPSDPNIHSGNNPEDIIVPDFSFDLKTCPMLFLHGNDDVYSPMGSVRLWEKMRSMGVQSELHILVGRNHCFQWHASPETASYHYFDRIWDFLEPRL
ncbi:MAG: alpha/beta hydrolase, partial [Bacteroidales bacterium]|nr:alpha/beta hydrolase [Bacteroidales bacterium]